jgi:hypothetical protein
MTARWREKNREILKTDELASFICFSNSLNILTEKVLFSKQKKNLFMFFL